MIGSESGKEVLMRKVKLSKRTLSIVAVGIIGLVVIFSVGVAKRQNQSVYDNDLTDDRDAVVIDEVSTSSEDESSETTEQADNQENDTQNNEHDQVENNTQKVDYSGWPTALKSDGMHGTVYAYDIYTGAKFLADSQAITIHSIKYRNIADAVDPVHGANFPVGHGIGGTEKWLWVDFETIYAEETNKDYSNEGGSILEDIGLYKDGLQWQIRDVYSPNDGTKYAFETGDPVNGNTPLRGTLLFPVISIEDPDEAAWEGSLYISWDIGGSYVHMNLPPLNEITGYVPDA